MSRLPRQERRDRRGATAVEFAMTLPILVALLMITVEFGFYFSQMQMVEGAAVDAARFGANQPTLGLAESGAEFAAFELLGDLGFDCIALGCTIDATTVSAGGINHVGITLRVPYTQLTGVLPGGALGVAIRVPQALPATASLPVVGPN